jgi:hypothetical protein
MDDAATDELVLRAKPLVRWPAVGLIATGCITFVLVLVGALGMGSIHRIVPEACAKIEQDPGLNPQQKQDIIAFYKSIEPGVAPVVIGSLALLALGAVVVIVGGFKLKNLSGRGWARASAVLAMIPFCVSYSCLLGMPFGIWAFVAMGKPEVKAAFAARNRKPEQVDDFDSPSMAV